MRVTWELPSSVPIQLVSAPSVFSNTVAAVTLLFALLLYYLYKNKHGAKIECHGKCIVVTGCDSGFGQQLVMDAVAAGFEVVAACYTEDGAAQYDDVRIHTVVADLTTAEGRTRVVDAARSIPRVKKSGLHALVNNAGISPKGENGERLDTLGTDLSTWGKVFHVNFFASVILARGLKEELLSAQGAIVNVTSIAGSRVHPFAGAAYATSKAALGALTREMSKDFGPLGVRVNAIAPGEVKTAILSEGTDKIVADIPMKRLGLPEEVADTIFYLCSKEASYVSGAEIEINGGQHV